MHGNIIPQPEQGEVWIVLRRIKYNDYDIINI
jgi:hypothetical protein